MKPAARLGDKAACPADAHGCKRCAHSVQGPAVSGSPDVLINGKPALRQGDAGIHSACCGPNTWTASQGSATVFINGMPAARMGDMTTHCGGTGTIIQGSGSVFIGDSSSSGTGKNDSSEPTCGICSLKKGVPPVNTTLGDETEHIGNKAPEQDETIVADEKDQKKKYIDFQVVDNMTSEPVINKDYTILVDNEYFSQGKTDINGYVFEEDVPEGDVKIIVDSDKYDKQ